MTAGAKSCTYCIYIFCHANCCYCFFLCFFFFINFLICIIIQKYSKCTRDFISRKYCNLSDISGDETLSEMKLVCPIVQDFYFPKLKICYKKKALVCLLLSMNAVFYLMVLSSLEVFLHFQFVIIL